MSTTPPGPEAPIPDPDIVVPDDERAEEELARRPMPDGNAIEGEPDEEDLAEEVLAEPVSKVSLDGVDLSITDVDPGGAEEVPPPDDGGVTPTPGGTNANGPRHCSATCRRPGHRFDTVGEFTGLTERRINARKSARIVTPNRTETGSWSCLA